VIGRTSFYTGALVAGMMGMACAGPVQRVLLRSGAEVRGEVLKTREETVLVDLGFTVLTLPKSEIVEMKEDEPVDATTPHGVAIVKREDLVSHEPARKEMSVEDNVKRVSEAVVQIQTASGLGSGFVINTMGHVVTNQHVIAGEQEIRVVMFRLRPGGLEKVTFEKVKIVAMNGFLDLALLQIDDESVAELPTVVVEDGDALLQGERVFAIGSPLGLERTVSQGIVSVRARENQGRWYIQTTTQINPGNSGGPLFNLRGEVVGVTNMKVAGVGVEGVGFAIPAGLMKQFLKSREAFAFDPRNANSGFRYLTPPTSLPAQSPESSATPKKDS
jgi:serine protease Do